MAGELHVYQCWVCRSTLTVTVKAAGTGEPYRCLNDRTPMTYRYSQPIESDDDHALAARCPVYNAGFDLKPYTKRPCGTCRTYVEADELIDVPGLGKFCSEACAQKGEAEMERLRLRVETLYNEMPWLRKGA